MNELQDYKELTKHEVCKVFIMIVKIASINHMDSKASIKKQNSSQRYIRGHGIDTIRWTRLILQTLVQT